MQRFAWAFLIAIALLPGTARAEVVEENYGAGSSAMSELLVGIGSRGSAMGGAGAACVDDLSAVFWNPARLRELRHPQLEFHHHSWIQDISQEAVFFGMQAAPNLTLAAGGVYFGIGTLETTGITLDERIVETEETIYLSAFGGLLSAALTLDGGFNLGANLKYFQENLGDYTPMTFAADMGFAYQLSDAWSVGVVASNLGLGVEDHGLPATLRLGGAYRMRVTPEQRLLAALDLEMLLGSLGQSRYHLGLEYTLFPFMALRLGYQMSDTTNAGMTGLTMGLGFELGVWRLGYAFAPQGDLGMSHRVSAGLEFLPYTPLPKKKAAVKAKPNDVETPLSPNAVAFGTLRAPALSSKGPGKTVTISKEEAAMRSLLEKNLNVTTEIRNEGSVPEAVYRIRRAAGTRIVKWNLTIMDRAKRVLRVYQGEDLPDMVIWNGRQDNGDLVQRIDETQYTLTLTDVNGELETDQGGFTLGVNRPLGVEEFSEGKRERKAFGPILFDVNRSEITREGAALIAKAADYIKRNPEYKIYIEAYTDSVDEGDRALVLSKKRAEAVVRYLTAYHSIPLSRILTRSRGIKSPAVSNDDPRQRFKNRRVMITVR